MTKFKSLIFCAAELAEQSEGRLVQGRPETMIEGFSIDSRSIKQGDIFIAINGTRFDGHEFVNESLRRGAAGIIISDQSAIRIDYKTSKDVFVILVRDTTRALQRLGRYVRRCSGSSVVAITGSMGKTTTKEMVAVLLEGSCRVFRSAGNLNNHIGVPLSLLELRKRPQVAVMELGMNHPGEISDLVSITEPDFRVWTNVAEVHSAFFNSIEEIADAKAEILEGASSTGHLVANAGDFRVMNRSKSFPGSLTTFGVEQSADVSARQVRMLGLEGMEANIETPVGSRLLRTPMVGFGHMDNIVAAIALALQFNIPLDLLVNRISHFLPQAGRGKIIEVGKMVVIDDTYNSNPAALQAALQAVGSDTKCSRRVAILGEMLELGQRSESLHELCGRTAVRSGFEKIILVGGDSVLALAKGAIAEGLPKKEIETFSTSKEAAEYAMQILQDGDVVLVKGSRGVSMEHIVNCITKAQAES